VGTEFDTVAPLWDTGVFGGDTCIAVGSLDNHRGCRHIQKTEEKGENEMICKECGKEAKPQWEEFCSGECAYLYRQKKFRIRDKKLREEELKRYNKNDKG